MAESSTTRATDAAYARKFAAEKILSDLANGQVSRVSARKQIGIMIGRGHYYGYPHQKDEGRTMYDVLHVAMVDGKAECYVVANVLSGSRKGETVLIPVLDATFGFFGVVSRDGYRGQQFVRAKRIDGRKHRRRAAA